MKTKILVGVSGLVGVVVGFGLGRIHENVLVYEKINDIIEGNAEEHIAKGNLNDARVTRVLEKIYD